MIELQNLVATYTTFRGEVNAVDGLNLSLEPGHIVGIAGESGCGKTTLLKVLYGNLAYPLSLTHGGVQYGFTDDEGEMVTEQTIKEHWFKHISYIPQSSMSSLNPVQRIKHQFVDFQGFTRKRERQDTLEKVREFIKELDLPPEAIDAYPHQLSGGMRQRVMVALATFFHPSIILADEPTTALDVVVQKGILLLLARLQAQMKSTIFFVSHDMGVHYQLSHKMLIMYAAKAVEFGDSETIFQAPLHPYTHLLIDALPKVGDNEMRQGVEGRPPSLWGDLKGCRFAPRCPKAKAICWEKEPALTDWKPGHFAACHFPDNL